MTDQAPTAGAVDAAPFAVVSFNIGTSADAQNILAALCPGQTNPTLANAKAALIQIVSDLVTQMLLANAQNAAVNAVVPPVAPNLT